MPLPFELPTVSLGFALLTPRACAVGRRAAAGIARALGALVGGEVVVTGRPLPAVPAPSAAATRLRVELTALPGSATLEIEASLAAAFLDRLGGGPGGAQAATSATPMERAAVELATLAALDAVASLPEVESRLAPRLVRDAGGPVTGLMLEVAIGLGGSTGRARLTLPSQAVRTLGEAGEWTPSPSGFGLELSLRGGSAPLLPEELSSLAPGDVVLLDPPPPGRLHAVAPGGLRLIGAESDGGLLIEEIRMPEPSMQWPIALEVELARVPVTLGELAALQPGGVLPLPIDRRGTVTLRIGDRAIARGQLVDVEGGLGVRIDALVEGP